jgi:hypothetical protein
LRVLSKQTLEISKEVKDPFVPDPSLVKVVKYSTLTILLSFRSISRGIVETCRIFGGFLQTGHIVGERRVRSAWEKVDLRPNLFWKGLPSPLRHFSSVLEGFLLHIHYFSWLGEFPKEGTTSLGGSVIWRVRSPILARESHHIGPTTSDLSFYNKFQGFRGQI